MMPNLPFSLERLSTEKAFGLLLGIWVILAFSILGLLAINLMIGQTDLATNYLVTTRAFYLAEASRLYALEYYAQWGTAFLNPDSTPTGQFPAVTRQFGGGQLSISFSGDSIITDKLDPYYNPHGKKGSLSASGIYPSTGAGSITRQITQALDGAASGTHSANLNQYALSYKDALSVPNIQISDSIIEGGDVFVASEYTWATNLTFIRTRLGDNSATPTGCMGDLYMVGQETCSTSQYSNPVFDSCGTNSAVKNFAHTGSKSFSPVTDYLNICTDSSENRYYTDTIPPCPNSPWPYGSGPGQPSFTEGSGEFALAQNSGCASLTLPNAGTPGGNLGGRNFYCNGPITINGNLLGGPSIIVSTGAITINNFNVQDRITFLAQGNISVAANAVLGGTWNGSSISGAGCILARADSSGSISVGSNARIKGTLYAGDWFSSSSPYRTTITLNSGSTIWGPVITHKLNDIASGSRTIFGSLCAQSLLSGTIDKVNIYNHSQGSTSLTSQIPMGLKEISPISKGPWTGY